MSSKSFKFVTLATLYEIHVHANYFIDPCILHLNAANCILQDEPRLIMVIRVRIDISYIIAQANLLPGPQLTASGLVKLLLLRKLWKKLCESLISKKWVTFSKISLYYICRWHVRYVMVLTLWACILPTRRYYAANKLILPPFKLIAICQNATYGRALT